MAGSMMNTERMVKAMPLLFTFERSWKICSFSVIYHSVEVDLSTANGVGDVAIKGFIAKKIEDSKSEKKSIKILMAK